MKIKTSELQGAALDWAVALALWGTVDIATFGPMFGKGFYGPCIEGRQTLFDPSTNWSQGGPIISKEKIDLTHCQNGIDNFETLAEIREHSDPTSTRIAMAWGKTDLIAAMRCYVASELGDEVDVPEELL